MSKRSATPETVEAFIKAVYPEATDLQAAFSSEGACLTDATELIDTLRQQLEEHQSKWDTLAKLCNDRDDQRIDANAKLAAASIREAGLLRALHTIGYEPVGDAEASHREVLESVTGIARAAIVAHRLGSPAPDDGVVKRIVEALKAFREILVDLSDEESHNGGMRLDALLRELGATDVAS